MKQVIFSGAAAVFFGCCGIAAAQDAGGAGSEQAAPAAVVTAAQAAVADLGKQVVLGKYDVAIVRMNPEWKQRMAARSGGMEKIERELARVPEEMVRQGVSIIAFQPQGIPRSFEVGPGKKVENVNGQEVESLIYTKWLVIVPTMTKFRIFPKDAQNPVVVESTGYQVAISEKGRNDWTFIDGSSLTLQELRKLFINLPADLELPKIEKRQAS